MYLLHDIVVCRSAASWWRRRDCALIVVGVIIARVGRSIAISGHPLIVIKTYTAYCSDSNKHFCSTGFKRRANIEVKSI